jgi:hypothetical protein
MRVFALATAVALLLGGPALADGPITTAPASGPAAPQPTTPAPPLSSVSTASQGPLMAMGPCGPEKVKPDGSLDTAPHGEVEAGVGTNGYRRLAGSVCQPIGQDGAVALSVGTTQGDGYRRH